MCDPVSIVAVGTAIYGGVEARQQRKQAEQTADQQAEDIKKQQMAQEALLKSRNANKQYQTQASFDFGQTTNPDGTTSIDGTDAFRIKPPGALNIPGGQA